MPDPTESSDHDKVVIQTQTAKSATAGRLLDLNRINTPNLKVLSPTDKEIADLKINRESALADYADRLRSAYRDNTGDFRSGLRLLSESLDKGSQIKVTCSCRNGGMCHADVVKMAVEKVNAHLNSKQFNRLNTNDKTEVRLTSNLEPVKTTNPRTQRAVNEILGFSENDRILEKIGETEGRNRSEQASHLGRTSQLVRDIYERGGIVIDGRLVVPQEKMSPPAELSITTLEFAAQKLEKILDNETRAKELAPVVVEYGHKIAGVTADGETKLKVFGWMYESLEGKNSLTGQRTGEDLQFDSTLREISTLAHEMASLEPIDKLEFVPLGQLEHNVLTQEPATVSGDGFDQAEIYEEAISRGSDENLHPVEAQNLSDQTEILEQSGKLTSAGYERVELGLGIPRIPEDYTQTEIIKLITETLPEIDRQIEQGTSAKEILAPFSSAVRESAREEAVRRLETIYRKQPVESREPAQKVGPAEIDRQIDSQFAGIDLRRQTVIELKNPRDYYTAEKRAADTFYRRQKAEIGRLLMKIDEARDKQAKETVKSQEPALKKKLKSIGEARPNFAFKLENSQEIVVGNPSRQSVAERNFISAYIAYQLKQPETRLRHENERYRIYAARLEQAASREELMKTASEIRTENASLGLKWKGLGKGEEGKTPRPLTSREMQFLFTEASPAHYTGEMTAMRLSFAHSGTSRRAITDTLLKGEISPSPEAQSLIESLESRLNRRDINDALIAAKHFFESIKIPNESLKYKNEFDHREVYQKLPPPEKDFVFQKALHQKENLEYRLAFRKDNQITRENGFLEKTKTEVSPAEKSFHLQSAFYQARILGEKLQPPILAQKEIEARDVSAIAVLVNNHSNEKLEATAAELQKDRDPENIRIAEIIQVFARAEISGDEGKTIVSIRLPDNRAVQTETYRELLEILHPDNPKEVEKYKFEHFGERRVSDALRHGQDEALRVFKEENEKVLSSAVTNLTSAESVDRKLERIGQFLAQARTARTENAGILAKYAMRAGVRNQDQKVLPSPETRKEIVSYALGSSSAKSISGPDNERYLKTVQNEITIGDYQKFGANERLLGEMKLIIREEFAGISKDIAVLEENKLKIGKISGADLAKSNLTLADKSEAKPLSLEIFEREVEKAEKQLFEERSKERLSVENRKIGKELDPKKLFSDDERAAIKIKAFETALEKLEPKELGPVNQKFSREESRQAFAAYKQLAHASSLLQTSGDKAQINQAFFKLDREAGKLNEIRENYDRAEKVTTLREGLKTDLIDWLRKNPELKQSGLEGELRRILLDNLQKSNLEKIANDSKQVGVLSREIAGHIGGERPVTTKEQTAKSASSEIARKSGFKIDAFDKVKEAQTFTR